jgi:aminoglycoside phosphotransferase (APT) family kinase protein
MADLDRAKLTVYLATKLGAENLAITSYWQNLEGWSMETYSLGLSYRKDGRWIEDEIIIRKEPVAGLLDPYDASIEFRVIAAMMKAGVAVPRVYWHEPDPWKRCPAPSTSGP